MGTLETVCIATGVVLVGGLIVYGLTRASTPTLPTYTPGPDQNATTNGIVGLITQLGTATAGIVQGVQAANRAQAATPGVAGAAGAGASTAAPQNRSSEPAFNATGQYYGTGTYNPAGFGR